MATDYSAISNYNIKQLGLDTKSRKSQVNMYSDSTHFIFEILQNADDYEATEISFKLERDKLVIEHNGIPFNEENVKAITYFGKSTSAEDLVKTGRFGIGFKSVFAFTASPVILSGEEQFQIYDLYKLRPYPDEEFRISDRTYIILPFNHLEFTPDFVETHLSAEEAYKKIASRLKNLDKKSILFTRNIKIIEWETQENKSFYSREDEDYQNENYRVSTISDDLKGTESKYLVFSKDVIWHEYKIDQQFKPVEVAFYLNENSQIIPGPSFLFVLFSTIQETHLKFIINGPFKTNPSRESIAYDDPFNLHLIKLVEELWPEILSKLKSKSFLTPSSLNALPCKNDELPVFYERIRKTIMEQFQQYEYLPTEDGSYTSAALGVSGPKQLKELFSNVDLSFLSESDSLKWIKNPKPSSRASNFIRSLNIQKWGWQNLVNTLQNKFVDPVNSYYHNEDDIIEFKRYSAWLLHKDMEWVQRFYIEIADAYKKGDVTKDYSYRTHAYRLPFEDCNIIIINAEEGLNTQSVANSRFPKEGYTGCVAESVLHHENEEIKALIRQSLETLGVTEINEEDEIKILLNQKYSNGVGNKMNEHWIKEHLQDLKRFARYYRENGDTKIFRGYQFLLINEPRRLESPKKIFVDEPFMNTGLNLLYEHGIDGFEEKNKLSHIYTDIFENGFKSFLKSLGVQFELVIHKVSTRENPHRDKLRSFYGSRETDTKIDRDYKIENLSAILEAKEVNLAKLVYEVVRKADPEVLTAQFRPNQEWSIKTAPSQLVHLLSNLSWIPTKSGEFKEPRFITESSLHDDFEYDNHNGWLDAIGFNGSPNRDEDDKEIAQRRGYASVDEMNEWDKLKNEARVRGMTPDDLRKSWIKDKPERPVSNPASIETLRTETNQGYKQSPKKSYSPKARVTRDKSTNEERKQYLKQLNTNSIGEMICQLCHEVMPFKYNREYYFEAVEILDRKRLPKEYFKQYLALCPNCAAKYKLYIKQDDRKLEDLAWAIKDLIIEEDAEAVQDDLEIALELDIESVLWFTKTHISDLQTILDDQPE